MRDRLIELINRIVHSYFAEEIANAVIADGWMKLPCKVGDSIYVLSNGMIHQSKIIRVKYEEEAENHGKFIRERIYAVICNVKREFNFSDIGKTVFLTREEAEQELEKRKEDEGK